MSFSCLRSIEACPLCWALKSAAYPGIWNSNGYPEIINTKALSGRIVHACIKKIIGELTKHKCPSIADPKTTCILKGMGGISYILEDCIKEELSNCSNNPRMQPIINYSSELIRRKIGEMREELQELLAKICLKNPQASTREKPLG